MKLQILSSLLLSSLFVFAQEEFEEEPVTPQLARFNIEPKFVAFESAETPDLVNGKETTVNFTVTNNEDYPVQVAAFGGYFSYPGQVTPYVNLTKTALSDVTVEGNSVKSFITNIKPTLPPTDFDLYFNFIVGYERQFSSVSIRPVSVTISDPPISAWDPKLLFVQVILGGAVMILGYYLSNTYILPYFVDPAESKKAAAVADKKASASKAKGYDESWIPKHHLTGGNKKTRKAH
ncbi:hypothetical protein D0Z00_002586 [Geotrichum galactomycetum]|uniref:Uncharacterized protein n=1 Tax=Geotrichum galactomycetum TaxID=27317 RepID=A0ACB6V3W1_9ASCO|nr:hypothetical protein D0Z00_002586 [Geotrichum candidum]